MPPTSTQHEPPQPPDIYPEGARADRERITRCLMGLRAFERQYEKDIVLLEEVAVQHSRYHEQGLSRR